MNYLNLDLDFFQHPKVRRLVGLLGDIAEVYPLRLWCYCGKYHPGDGKLSGYSIQEIESVLDYQGTSEKLVEALIKVRLLHKTQDGYAVHDWKEHSGHLSAFKDRAKKGAKARWDKYRHATSNAQASIKHSLEQCPIPTLPTNQPTKNKVFRHFVPPTLEMVTEYCMERGNGVNPTKWINHYTANGWKVGRNQMKDWKAAVRTWEQENNSKLPDRL